MNRITSLLGYLVLLSSTLFFLPVLCVAQDYQIAIFHIPCVSVELDQPGPGKINFRTKTIGIIDLIWPVDNSYNTVYDTTSFGAQSFHKNISQGNFTQKLKFTVDPVSGIFKYDKQIEVRRNPETYTIFTLLARITQASPELLDTYWFPMEHEGKAYKMRLLWADSTKLELNRTSYNCDYYRLDIVPDNSEASLNITDRSDYFSEYIVHPEAVRQIWVEKGGRQRRIIKASVKLLGFTLEAKLNE